LFRENNDHLQECLFESTNWMDTRIKTYRKKGNKAESGYVLNITETCSEENPFQLITDYTVEKNIKSDVELAKERISIVKQNTGCEEIYVDGGYYSEEVVQLAKENKVELHFTDFMQVSRMGKR